MAELKERAQVMEEAKQQYLDALIEQNAWRNGLSLGEQTCFEAGWDAALAWLRISTKKTLGELRELFAEEHSK